VVEQIAGDVQQDAGTERDVATAQRDLTAGRQPAIPDRPQDQVPQVNGSMNHQVAVGDIPLEPPGFRPRPSLLAKLDRAGAGVSVIHTTTGLQGRGTTQLAAAYARAKLAAGWRLVAWVSAADTDSTQAGLTAVANAIGLTRGASGQPAADAGQAVRQLLEADGDRCLLVFDDVTDPEALSPFIPAVGTAQVLIVSTRQLTPELAVSNPASTVPVDVFSADEALSFLIERTGQDDEARAAEVAAVLGYLPLALALAAPMIREQRHGYARYLDRLQMAQATASLAGDDGQRYPHDVERAVLLSLAAIRGADKTGMHSRVMAIMALLSAAGVRREVLHVAGRAGVLGNGRRVAADVVDQVLERLSDRSLLTFSLDGQTITVHRLVARVIRDGLIRRGRLGAVCWVAGSVLEAHAIAVAGPQDRPAIRHIPQQVSALLGHAAQVASEGDEELADILLRLRFISLYHLIELGDSAPQAIAVGEPLTADLELMLGPGHPETLNARNSLAAAYLTANRIADAIQLSEQTLEVLVSQLGAGHPDTLTSRNTLASAYQDAGRLAEAIELYELNLAERKRLLGDDDPGTLTSQGNLAAAYLAAGRTAEAIPLLEQTLASRERVLGPNDSDTRTSRRNLARAYQDAGRDADAVPLLEQEPAGPPPILRPDHPQIDHLRVQAPPSQPPGGAAAAVPSVSFRRPPADPARPALPVSFRRPPADAARTARPDRVAGPPVRLPGHATSGPVGGTPPADAEDDREVLASIMEVDPAGIAKAYDRYAVALYGYCRWRLRDAAAAAESVQDTFVLAAAKSARLPEPGKLRAWLFALARNDCQRRGRPWPTTRDMDDVAVQRTGGHQRADETGTELPSARELDPGDATMQFRAIRDSGDTTVRFRAIRDQGDVVRDPGDATMRFRAIRDSGDATTQFRAIRDPGDVVRDSGDATMQFAVVGPLTDTTMQFRVIGQPADSTDGVADFSGYLGQAELRELIRSILADMKPREREVVELSFRHDLNDDDLGIVLGLSGSRAQHLAARTRSRVEKSFGVLRAALAGRQACPVMGELLADWDGQLTEQTRDLVTWHIEQCQVCVSQGGGALRPTILSGLMPLPALPPELRKEVLNLCSSGAEDAVANRRRIVRRAESTWVALSSQVRSRVGWSSIRANPGVAIAAVAVTTWIVTAVIVTLIAFASPHAAHSPTAQPTKSRSPHAQVAQASTGRATRKPAAGRTAATTSASAPAQPAPTVTQPAAYVPSPTQPASSPARSNPPSPSASATPSTSPPPKPSKSSSPQPSTSPSPSTSSPASSSPPA
jgi:RNA polymerase sigma factor (sigma-70 family)